MIYELVKLVDGIPVYNDMLRDVPVFAAIIRRDRGSEGDAQGKKKLIALKELEAIFWLCDWRSNVFTYSEDTWISKAAHYAKLPPDWEPDELVLAAMEFYRTEMNNHVALEQLNELRDTFRTGTKVIKASKRYLDSQIQHIEVNAMVPNGQGQTVSAIEQCITMLDSMQKLLKSLPAALDQIKELEDKVKSTQTVRGKANRELNEFEI